MGQLDEYRFYVNDLGDPPKKYKDHVVKGDDALCGRLQDRASLRATAPSIQILSQQEYMDRYGLDSLSANDRPDGMCRDCWNRLF